MFHKSSKYSVKPMLNQSCSHAETANLTFCKKCNLTLNRAHLPVIWFHSRIVIGNCYHAITYWEIKKEMFLEDPNCYTPWFLRYEFISSLNFGEVTDGRTDRDRNRCIWAHREYTQVCSKSFFSYRTFFICIGRSAKLIINRPWPHENMWIFKTNLKLISFGWYHSIRLNKNATWRWSEPTCQYH